MANKNTDFLRFSAYSLKDLIVRKLSEDKNFTDQIYEGSNLNTLIDLVAYMYQCLVYQLNNAASESMFQDTQIYENIIRLIKLLGYNAKGCYPASFNSYINFTEQPPAELKCLRYSRIDTKQVDSQGNTIYFSTKSENVDSDKDTETIDDATYFPQTFYNGKYKMYSTIFTASGLGNETFVLSNIKSDVNDKKYVAHDFINVYIQDKEDKIRQWCYDYNGIFTRSINLDKLNTENTFYVPSVQGYIGNIFTSYLNENKEYEIKFGDGTIGEKLNEGDRVIVLYLDTNGYEGKIDISKIDFTKIKIEHNASMLGMSEELYQKFKDNGIFSETYLGDGNEPDYNITLQTAECTDFIEEESVDTIRKNAPNWFKTGNRLITHSDYEYFMKNNELVRQYFNGAIVDVVCMNNIEYVSSFYKWLYMQGKINHPSKNGRTYFNQQFFNRTNYKNIDAADANNTYLWVKSSATDVNDYMDSYDVNSAETNLNEDLKPFKTMTTEIQVLKPVYVNFDICAASNDDVRNYITNYKKFDPYCESCIEVTLDDNTIYVSTQVQETIYKIILNEFNINNCTFGMKIKQDNILNKIYSISGVKNVRTTFSRDGQILRAYDGISFASWSPVLDLQNDVAIDISIGNGTRLLQNFQFPRFIGEELLKNRIVLLKKQLTPVNTIKM